MQSQRGNGAVDGLPGMSCWSGFSLAWVAAQLDIKSNTDKRQLPAQSGLYATIITESVSNALTG